MIKKLLVILIIFSSLFSTNTYAWDDCPHEQVNDPYPGDCSKYVDTDNDKICDLSQSAPGDRSNNVVNIKTEEDAHDLITGKDLKTKTVNEIAQIYQINPIEYAKILSDNYDEDIKPNISFQLLHDNYGVEPSTAKNIALSLKTGQQIEVSEPTNGKQNRTYHLLPIFLFLILLYTISIILSKKKIISALSHRKIWNVLLLLTFLISGLLGILLIIKINFEIAIPLPFNILFWHVEIGIVMFTICMFHIIERRYYFKNLFISKK